MLITYTKRLPSRQPFSEPDELPPVELSDDAAPLFGGWSAASLMSHVRYAPDDQALAIFATPVEDDQPYKSILWPYITVPPAQSDENILAVFATPVEDDQPYKSILWPGTLSDLKGVATSLYTPPATTEFFLEDEQPYKSIIWPHITVPQPISDEAALGYYFIGLEDEQPYKSILWPYIIVPPAQSDEYSLAIFETPVEDEQPYKSIIWPFVFNLPVQSDEPALAVFAHPVEDEQPYKSVIWTHVPVLLPGQHEDSILLLTIPVEDERQVYSQAPWPYITVPQARSDDDTLAVFAVPVEDERQLTSTWTWVPAQQIPWQVDEGIAISLGLSTDFLLKFCSWPGAVSDLWGTQLVSVPGVAATLFLETDPWILGWVPRPDVHHILSRFAPDESFVPLPRLDYDRLYSSIVWPYIHIISPLSGVAVDDSNLYGLLVAPGPGGGTRRIFGLRVYGTRVYGRVFGGLGGTALNVFGWLNVSGALTDMSLFRRRLALYTTLTSQVSWVTQATTLDRQQQLAAIQTLLGQEYRQRARKPLLVQLLPWTSQEGWLQTGADIIQTGLSGWRSFGVRELPPLSTRGVRQTLSDPAWLSRTVPAIPISTDLLAGFVYDKGGLPPPGMPKYPYLRYPWSAQEGWNWYTNILPIILAGAASWTALAQSDYTLRRRAIAPYMQEWKPLVGWMLGAASGALYELLPGIFAQNLQEYTLRSRATRPYISVWFGQDGWYNFAENLVVLVRTSAFSAQMRQEPLLRRRAPLSPLRVEWQGALGWVLAPAFQDVALSIAPASAQALQLARPLMRSIIPSVVWYDYRSLNLPTLIEFIPEDVGQVVRIVAMGIVTNLGE